MSRSIRQRGQQHRANSSPPSRAKRVFGPQGNLSAELRDRRRGSHPRIPCPMLSLTELEPVEYQGRGSAARVRCCFAHDEDACSSRVVEQGPASGKPIAGRCKLRRRSFRSSSRRSVRSRNTSMRPARGTSGVLQPELIASSMSRSDVLNRMHVHAWVGAVSMGVGEVGQQCGNAGNRGIPVRHADRTTELDAGSNVDHVAVCVGNENGIMHGLDDVGAEQPDAGRGAGIQRTPQHQHPGGDRRGQRARVEVLEAAPR